MAAQTYQLVMRSGPTPGRVYELTQPKATIGRDPTNEIVINHPEMSRKHAILTLQTGGYVIEDTGSTNGTYVHGQRLMGPHLLRPGELILFGENISLAYEALPFDADATQVSQPGAPATVAAKPPIYVPPPLEASPQPVPRTYKPSYSGQVPPGPVQSYPPPGEPLSYTEEEEERPRSRLWLFAGCGCLLVLLCIGVAGIIFFDYQNLYCTWPFSVLDFLWTCP